MTKKQHLDEKDPVLNQQPVPPAGPVVVPPLVATGYGVTGNSAPVSNRAMALLNVRSVKN